MKNLESWARLAGAAFNAKDEFARILPRLDAAIAAADTTVLVDVRAMVIRHSGALTAALKHPTPRPERRTPPRASLEPLWGTSEGVGRYRQRERRAQ